MFARRIFDMLDTYEEMSSALPLGVVLGVYSCTHHKVGIQTLHVDALVLDFFSERSGECRQESLCARISGHHRRRDAGAGERAHVQDQATLPIIPRKRYCQTIQGYETMAGLTC